jgi:hypothetical protein
MNGKWLTGLIFIGVLGLGIALVRRPLSDRAVALAAVAIALLLIGVFLPTFSTQVMTGGLWLAIGLTAIVWFAVYAVTRPKRPRDILPAPTEAPPPTATPPVESPPASQPSEGGESHG